MTTMMIATRKCLHGHALPLGGTRCAECNRIAVRRYRNKQAERAVYDTHAEGPIWQLLRAKGYLNHKPPKRRNSLGLFYRGP